MLKIDAKPKKNRIVVLIHTYDAMHECISVWSETNHAVGLLVGCWLGCWLIGWVRDEGAPNALQTP